MNEKKYKILVVDDSKSMQEVVMRYLRDHVTATFFRASDGAEAETILQENLLMETPIDLVILDWMMPKVTGYQFLQKIRASQAFPDHPPVVMLSAETFPDQIAAAMKHHVAAYLKKPFTQSELVKAVLEVLEQKEYSNAV